MNVKISVRKGETLEEALIRFRHLLWRFGPPGTNLKRPKWHKKQLDYYLKPSERRRRDHLRDEFKKFVAECSRRHLIVDLRRHSKRRKAYFNHLPFFYS